MPTKNNSIIVLFVAILLIIISSLASAIPVDIRGHWAEHYIRTLLIEDIMQPRPDGYFRPDLTINRGDLMSLARLKGLESVQEITVSDLSKHPQGQELQTLVNKNIVNLFPDSTFRPDEHVTRGEMAAILQRCLELDDTQKGINPAGLSTPTDMPQDHWALDAVKIITKLGLIPCYPDGTFRPQQGLTRAELAQTLTTLSGLRPLSSFLHEIYPASEKIALESLDSSRQIISIADNAILGRNNRLVELEEMSRNDRVYLLLNPEGEAVYVKAYGLMTRTDITTEISRLTRDILSPDDISSLMDGDYSSLWNSLGDEAQKTLIKQGFSRNEVEALMQQDWNRLENMGKIRVGEILSMETGLPLDMTRALMNQDWNLLQDLTKLELIQRVLQEVMALDIFQM